MNMKTCQTCLQNKSIELFGRFRCLDCQAVRNKNRKRLKDNEYKARNREKLNRQEKERRAKIKQNNLINGISKITDKICSCCGEKKITDNFTLDISSFDGLASYCKQCTSIKTKQYRQNNAETIKQRKLEYCKNNRTKEAERARKWREKNPERHAANIRKRERERYHNDIGYFLRQIISKEIGRGLKKRGSSKNEHSCLKFLPFTIEELKQHLESHFDPWMNWDNHGIYKKDKWDDNNSTTWTWQIDHIIRHANFKYTSMEDDQFKKCWSLENLRPLSAKINNKENFR